MGFSPEYRSLVEERLSAVAPIRSRAMFGGVGIYGEELIFALIAEDNLYFKVGELNRADYEAAGMHPFFPYDSPTPMGYYELPPGVLNDPTELSVWVEKAIAVAHSTKRPKSKRG